MALNITRALVHLYVEPGSTTPPEVEYTLTDANDVDLKKRGTLPLTLPARLRSEIAVLVEDSLRVQGIL